MYAAPPEGQPGTAGASGPEAAGPEAAGPEPAGPEPDVMLDGEAPGPFERGR